MEADNTTNETIENVFVDDTTVSEQLSQIHNDLGFIACFIIFFTLVIILKYTYKFFDMIFKY